MLRLISLIALPLIAVTAMAQQRQQFTSADYARAEKFMGYNTTPLVYKSVGSPDVLEPGRHRFQRKLQCFHQKLQ